MKIAANGSKSEDEEHENLCKYQPKRHEYHEILANTNKGEDAEHDNLARRMKCIKPLRMAARVKMKSKKTLQIAARLK